jgi:drug/metabolite transporter (DMT)-like permease
LPGIAGRFLMWTVVASLTQIAATALLLRCMEERNLASALPTPGPAYLLVSAQVLQTILIGGYLVWRQRTVVVEVLRAWRVSLMAGAMGALGSACWFTAMAMEPVANVRTLGLVELYFSYVVSQRFFRERLSSRELAGFILLALGLLGVLAPR